MDEFRCKDLGFDCDFTKKDSDNLVLIQIKDHLKSYHGVAYQEKFLQNIFKKKQKRNSETNDFMSCDEYSCGMSLDKWKPGHRNFP